MALHLLTFILISTLCGCITFSDPQPVEPKAVNTLYEKYGGASRVHDWAGQLHTQIKPHNGHPHSDHLKFCLEMQLTSILGGPSPYPGIIPGHPQCMDHLTAHAPHSVTPQDFDTLAAQIIELLQNDGVDGKDIQEVLGPILNLKAELVNSIYE